MPTAMIAYFIPGRFSGSFSKARALRLLPVLLLSTILASLFSAASIAQRPKASAIRGIVNDAKRNPVPDAAVLLQQDGVDVTVTRTDAHGSFAFVDVRPGKYSVRAEKADVHASVAVSTRDAVAEITLTLSANDSHAESMDFTDKPNFTVAGITDWTAVGGHGSDASLRTSETLARETATLRPDGAFVAAHTSDTASALRAAAAASPESFVANLELGRFYLQKGSYHEAVPPLEIAYRIDPADRSNEYDLAFAYKESGELNRAREHTQHLLAGENTADLHRLAGDVDEAMGNALSAEREYETAVRLDPTEPNEFTWGAELLLHRAVWPAIEVLRKGAAAYPRSARMLSALGVALFASAQYEEAAQYLCEASNVNPADTALNTFLGEIEIAAPAPLGCAEQKLARFAQTQPGSARAKYYYAMAILKRQGVPANSVDVEHAQTLLTGAAELDPKYGEAYLQLGILRADRKDYRQAIDLFTRAIEVNPQLGAAHYRLGVAYQRTGLAAKAQQEFERHDEIEKAQAEAVEEQRHKIKQFMVVLQGQSPGVK
jgi:tetratricopeptide (TPR) repeat protein